MAFLSRRKLFTTLGAFATAALIPNAAVAKRKTTRRLISDAQCSSGSAPNAPFALASRGVGTVLLRASVANQSVCIVIPTLAKAAKTTREILGLGGYNRDHGKVDNLIVCALHSHWDHAWHLDHFRQLMSNPEKGAQLFANDIVFDKSKIRTKYDVSRYVENRVSGATPPPTTLIFGDISVRLRFFRQGANETEGHARHAGTGARCNSRRRHCGSRLVVRHDGDIYAMIATMTLAGEHPREFTFFINDAASGYVAQSLPSPLPTCDLALITASDAHLAYGYPDDLVKKLAPTHVRWIHWEDFGFFPKRSTKIEKLPRLMTGLVLPRTKVESLMREFPAGCFPRHGYLEHFEGRGDDLGASGH